VIDFIVMNIIYGFHNLGSENRGGFGEKELESPEHENQSARFDRNGEYKID
jgi:hypothetical protein